jgi:hypothetical protein
VIGLGPDLLAIDLSAPEFGLIVGMLGVAAGLAAAVYGRRALQGPRVTSSQREFRGTRNALNRKRAELAERAAGKSLATALRSAGDAQLLPGTNLLTNPAWLPPRPLPLDALRLNWAANGSQRANDARLNRAARKLLPLYSGRDTYDSYSDAVADLDPPGLFEDRPSYRLVDVSGVAEGAPELTFARTSYFRMIDSCEALAHEIAGLAQRRSPDSLLTAFERTPMRNAVGNPFDLTGRHVIPSLNVLTMRLEGQDASFYLHRRDPAKVAVAGGMFHVIPAGTFQPSSRSPAAEREDFDLWKCAMREYSEELLGNEEATGSAGFRLDYDSDEPFRSLQEARRSGACRPYVLGLALDPLTLCVEILVAVCFSATAFDSIFADLAEENAEGTLIVSERRDGRLVGIPFEDGWLAQFAEREPLAPAARGCLALAWEHRETLLRPDAAEQP